jgi:demethylmenaquinone methyltransferase/2-methoxy-6-polyprenyl-1,4-benzoquinol methylase
MKFYWDTIDQCVPPETILDVLRKTGFVDVKLQRTYVAINEYTATKPLK